MHRIKPISGIITILLIFILFSGCGKEAPKPAAGLNEKLKFDENEYISYLKNRLTAETVPAIDTLLQFGDTLKYIYAERDYRPFFIKSFEEESFVTALLGTFEKSGDEGLNPESYHTTSIKNEFLDAVNKGPAGKNYIHLVNAELLAADGILKYAYHLRYGVVNPKEIFADSYFLPSADSASRNLLEPLRQENIFQYLRDIRPKNPEYAKLIPFFKKFKEMQGIQWDPIQLKVKKLQPGDNDTSVGLITKRLIILGFADSVKVNPGNYYDTLLAAAVKKFQAVNGLKDDGVIGKSTVDRLNLTPADYLNRIKVSLERFRWNDYSKTDHYLKVNVPAFMLYVFEKGKLKFDIKVCTGRRRSAGYERQYEIYKKNHSIYSRPDDWETPCMQSEISHLVLNPTWTVPQNIIREEIAIGLSRDSSYLVKKNFKVKKNGIEVNPLSIRPEEITKANIPYSIVQDPGAGNALGKIKFMFSNPFGIYLHDTPTRAPFTYTDRAVSHGCIRVEKPLMLTDYLLQFQSKWKLDYLKIEIGSRVDDKNAVAEYRKVRSDLRRNLSYGPTTELKLERKVPVFVDYYTSWADDNGFLNIRDDVYRKDSKLLEALNRAR